MKLTSAETRDIRLWFGWGAVLGYPTGPLDYLRAMMAPDMRPRFLEQPRPKRKAILRFVIDEHARRSAAQTPMKCPECGAPCWRNDVDVGIGIISDEWKCTECSWDEDQAFPMSDSNWEDFLRADVS